MGSRRVLVIAPMLPLPAYVWPQTYGLLHFLPACHKRQEKIEALTARAQFVPSALTDLELEVTFPAPLEGTCLHLEDSCTGTQAPSYAAAPTYVCV